MVAILGLILAACNYDLDAFWWGAQHVGLQKKRAA
jgi:hypothetical protein